MNKNLRILKWIYTEMPYKELAEHCGHNCFCGS